MKRALVIIIILLAGALTYGLYLWNKPAKSAASEEVFATTDAASIYQEFYNNPEGSAKKYLNKNLQINGMVESFSQDSTGLKCVLATGSMDMGVVSVTFLENNATLQVGQSIVIRGLCAGYLSDDLMGGNLQLNQAVLVQ
jgi:hypothetical protein